MEEVVEWFLLSSRITKEYTLLMDGRGSIMRTWAFKTTNWSFNPVRNWITWPSSLKLQASLMAAELEGCGQVQWCIGGWEFKHRKIQKMCILSMCILSAIEKCSLRSNQASMANSWKTSVWEICGETELIIHDWIRWLHRSHALQFRSSSSGISIDQQRFKENPKNMRRIKEKARRFTKNQWRNDEEDEESCCNKLF